MLLTWHILTNSTLHIVSDPWPPDIHTSQSFHSSSSGMSLMQLCENSITSLRRDNHSCPPRQTAIMYIQLGSLVIIIMLRTALDMDSVEAILVEQTE